MERWLGKITTERIRRGTFTSVPQLERAIYDYIEHNNADPKSFVWTKSANRLRAGRTSQANTLAYNCARQVEVLTRTLAVEGRDGAIRVNAVAPGLVDTEANIAAMKPKEGWVRRQDIAQVAVLFLASAASAGITRQVIPVMRWGI